MKKYTVILLLFFYALLSYSLSTNLEILEKAKLHPKKAAFSRTLPEKKVQCTLCPHYCVLSKGEKGKCRSRANLQGELYTLVYNSPLALHLDPIEKKPLYHFMPGTKTLSLATAGCNLKCIFCQNWSISQAEPESSPHYSITPMEIIETALKMKADSIAFTYTEPTIFYEYMLDIAKLAKENNLKTLYITCGYINPEPLTKLIPYLDAANIDLKGYSEEFYRKYCSAKLKPVLECIKSLYQAGVHIEITNLIIPHGNDQEEMIRNMCKWIKTNTSKDIPVHFSRFHPAYQLKNLPPTSSKTLLMAKQIALEEGLSFPYIGNLEVSGGSSTYCPKCKKLIIQRKGFQIIEKNLKINKNISDKYTKACCVYCNQWIYGTFQD